MNVLVKRFLKVAVIPMAVVMFVVGCKSTTKNADQGAQGQTQNVCDVLKPLPSGSGPIPSPDAQQLSCLNNVRQTIGTLSEDNKVKPLMPERLKECKDALVTWHAWTDRQSDAWFTANNMSRKLPGDCGMQPTPTKR
ncbi:MAG TPA: hypothetical protein VLF64_02895 [Candidatus Saccharimonadales bacterium]|nr:hypothetical protein [Candidatus Saccharimonadales bacterium]